MTAPERGPWRPSGLASWEITAELSDPATSLVRRAELAAEQDGRRRDQAAALERAREVAEQTVARVAGLLGAGASS